MAAPSIPDPGTLRDLTHAQRVDRLVALERLRSWVDAGQNGAEATLPLDDATTTEVESRVLPDAGAQTRAEFARVVRREVTRVDARRAEERHRAAMAEHRVVCSPAGEGTAEFWALLPADAAAGLMTTLDALAHDPALPDPAEFGLPNQGVDDRTADQRRADALTLLANHILHRGAENVTTSQAGTGMGVGTWQGQRPQSQSPSPSRPRWV